MELTESNMPEEEVIEEKSILDISLETAIRIIQKNEGIKKFLTISIKKILND